MNKLAENLKNLMESEGITQARLAEILCVSQQTVSKYINGKIEPSLDMLILIAKYFKVTTDHLLGLED